MDESGGLGCSALIDVQPRGLGPFVLVDGSFRFLLADRRKPKSKSSAGSIAVDVLLFRCPSVAKRSTGCHGEKLAKVRW